MKNSKYVLIVVAVVVVILVGMMKTKSPVTKTPEVIDLCYVYNTEAGDNASLRISFSGENGTDVSGSFNFRPAEKDSKTGTFTGVAGPVDTQTMSRVLSVLWQASAEGATVPEELSIIITDKMAAAGFGEMKDRGDGTYIYADPQSLSYAPNLQQTDCSDPALQ